MENIKNVREENEITQNYIAKILGIKRSTYASYETGRDTMPIQKLNHLCNYFNISIDYALGLTKTKKYSNSKKNINLNLVKIRLKELRKTYKLTQQEIADILNISRSTWTGYEYGNFRTPTLILQELAKKYNFSVDYILGKIPSNPLKPTPKTAPLHKII